MATDDGDTASILIERIRELLPLAHRTNFFPLVAMLERASENAVRIGGDGPPAREAVRFRNDCRLAFAPGDVASASIKEVPVALDDPRGPKRPVVEVVTTFLGLTGALSPLPLYIADEVNHEDDESNVKRDFLDVFHHRLVSILYRAVSRYSPVREHRGGRRDVWMGRAFSLSGLDEETYVSKCPIPDGKLLRLSPLLAQRARGFRSMRSALRFLVDDYLGPRATLRIRELSGGFVPLNRDQRSALGIHNSILGHGIMLGGEVFDRSGSFEVVIGPLDHEGRVAFSEGGKGLDILRAGVGLMITEPLDFDVKLEIAAGASRPFKLSTETPSKLGANTRLGRSLTGETVRIRHVGRGIFSMPAPPQAEPAQPGA